MRAAVVVAALAVIPGCALKSAAPDETTTTVTAESTTTVPPLLSVPAIWPAVGTVFATPENAARDFVQQVLEVTPNISAYRSVTADKGEIDVYIGENVGTPTTTVKSTLTLRRFRADGGWFVTAATNKYMSVEWPDNGAIVTRGVIEVRGAARGFEGQVSISAFLPGKASTPLATDSVIAGSAATPKPFKVRLDASAAPAGAVVAILVRGGRGLEQDPGEFTAIFVTAG